MAQPLNDAHDFQTTDTRPHYKLRTIENQAFIIFQCVNKITNCLSQRQKQ